MNSIEKSKFLTVVIIALLLLNFGTLAFLWTHDRGGHREEGHPDLFHFVVREVGMNEEQESKYATLRDDHHGKMLELQEQSRKLHDQYFNLLHASTADSSRVKQLADSLAANQEQMDLVTFYHFQQVRALCTPEQQKRFDQIIDEAMNQMGRRPPDR